MITENLLRMHAGSLFGEKIRFVTAPDLIKCLKYVKQRLHLTCTPIFELPSNISTMIKTISMRVFILLNI